MSEEQPVISTFQLDQESKRKLQEVSARTERSMSATLRWLINQEWYRLNAERPFQVLTPPKAEE